MSAISSIAGLVRGGQVPKAARCYITPLDIHNNDAHLDDLTRTFQYFPETIHDTKAINYQAKPIPGLSHPLYQWTGGGERIIQFTAIFTRDRALSQQERDIYYRISSQATNSRDDAQRNVDIPSALAWLRSFQYPEMTADGNVGLAARPLPPRKLILGLTGTRINQGCPELNYDEVYALMMACDVTLESFFSDGTPRITRVNLSFAETIQIAGEVHNQDAADRRDGAIAYRFNNKSRQSK